MPGVRALSLLAVPLAEVPDLGGLTDRLDLEPPLAVNVGTQPPASLALVKLAPGLLLGWLVDGLDGQLRVEAELVAPGLGQHGGHRVGLGVVATATIRLK